MEGRKPLRVRSPQFFPTSLSINKKPMDGRLSSMQNCEAILQSRKKSHGWIFFRAGSGNVVFSSLPKSNKPWRAALRMQNCAAILQSLKKAMEGFFECIYAGLEGRRSRCQGQWRRMPEPRKARGAKACSVELAKKQNGRANKSTVQKKKREMQGLLFILICAIIWKES